MRRRLCWLLSAAATVLAACGDEQSPPAYGPDVVLVVDGLEIRRQEIERFQAIHASTAPELGRRTIVRYLLENHVLPLRYAQRAFADRRAELREQARLLTTVAGNVVELEQRCEPFFHQRKLLNRRQVEAPVAEFAFDRERLGSVSEPLEVPKGFVVAGCFDIQESAIVSEDLADLLQVGFLTHTNAEWVAWLRSEFDRTADKVTYVHPDYREALPFWLKLP